MKNLVFIFKELNLGSFNLQVRSYIFMIAMLESLQTMSNLKNHSIIIYLIVLKVIKKNKRVWKLMQTNAQIRTQIKDWVNII